MVWQYQQLIKSFGDFSLIISMYVVFFGKSQYYLLENILNPKYLFVRVGIGYGSNWTWKWNPLGKHITYSLKVKYNSFKHMYVGTFVYTYNKYFLNITCIRKYCIYVGMCVYLWNYFHTIKPNVWNKEINHITNKYFHLQSNKI